LRDGDALAELMELQADYRMRLDALSMMPLRHMSLALAGFPSI
jgi:hypothetical protein